MWSGLKYLDQDISSRMADKDHLNQNMVLHKYKMNQQKESVGVFH